MKTSMKWMKWVIAAIVVVVLALVAGPFVYINFIKDDAPDRFALDDAPEANAAAPTITGSAGSTADRSP